MKNPENELRVQILEENNFNKGKLYRLKKDWFLKLHVSTKLISKNVRVFCNLPEEGQKFSRNTYYEYKWQKLPDSLKHDDFNKFILINCQQAGSYNYYFTLDNTNKIESSRGGSNFLVDPKLCLNTNEYIDLDCLQIQTFLSKLLGPLDEWKSRLEVAKHSGYNMIHFTPISDLSSESNSSYCIRNHLQLLNHANKPEKKFSIDDLSEVVEFIYKEWNIFSICDLVYNHMANDADFLKTCPEATYNMVNCPYLIPAFVLDRLFVHVTNNISKGVYESKGISIDKLDYSNIETLRHIIRLEEIPKYKFEEFFQMDLEKVMTQIKNIRASELTGLSVSEENSESLWTGLQIKQDETYVRLSSSIDLDIARKILILESRKNDNQKLEFVYARFLESLRDLNEKMKQKIRAYLDEAVENVMSNFKYHFFAADGPKWPKVTKNHPIVARYFYFPFDENSDVFSEEILAYDQVQGAKIQAHNGWVMTDDPLQNFAAKGSLTYFRRHLIAWDDSVKLKFGDKPADNPKLWSYMADYTRLTAKIFHGVRLDNCHSTPIHVAQYFLDIARSTRPDLYVTAELFTNSMDIDNTFVTELGITSLIRESMNAWNAQELGRLVHRFGGNPVGSFFQQSHRPLDTGIACATFFDITHDNESLVKKHCVLDVLPTSSVVLMSGCAVGSTRGFDELVPHHIHVVDETRPYSVWNSSVDFNTGIVRAKHLLNKLHYEMGVKGFSQIYVDQFDDDTISVTRHNPQTHESYIMIARTAFAYPHQGVSGTVGKPLEIPSRVVEILIEANTVHDGQVEGYVRNEMFVNGIRNYRLELQENLKIEASRFVDRIDYDGDKSYVNFKYFPPGAVSVFKVELNEKCLGGLPLIRQSIFELSNTCVDGREGDIDVENILGKLNFDELNILLFRCSNEEAEESINSNTYDVPKHGRLVYCGLQGFMNVLEKERLGNNLGHPMFENLRQGNWMMEYITDRLRKYSQLQPKYRHNLFLLSEWLKCVFDTVQTLPRYLIPAYFDLIITELYTKALERCLYLMSSSRINNTVLKDFEIVNGSSFLRSLGVGSVLFTGYLKSALLPDTVVDKSEGLMLSLSAGLPHFSTTYMRNWGRDTFISVRGLLLLTNRFKEAKDLILSYASTLRHGLIPNLLGEGKMSRFNCRDAVWWWLKAIRDYTELAPDSYEILNCKVLRLYPNDDSTHPTDEDLKERNGTVASLASIIQEALEGHVRGLKFRERNAGLKIDEHMLDEGFNNEIGVDLETGFVFGGNKLNCGTWMDKLGSSSHAGNKGLPATPRDGSAVELVGLSRSALEWLITAHSLGKYPYDSVMIDTNNKIKYTWCEWAQRIDTNFEKYFWVGEDSNESVHINKRNIYKDTLNSTVPWTDYQLRPNFLIAITVAPQMINKEHARKALVQVRDYLVNENNSVGIKTLDASDFNYCGVYDNGNHSNDPKLAHGFNYHQGPEWLWPIGYFLRAELFYLDKDSVERDQTLEHVKEHLGKLYEKLNSNDWKSLPELTNRNGEDCYFSCPAQAWSVATTLEVFYDLATYKKDSFIE